MPKAKSKDKLTAKERRFINEYMKDLNQSQAALRAGYKTRQSGAENMSKPVIKAEIDRRLKLEQMSADEAVARLGRQARADMREFMGLTMSDLKVHPDAVNIKKMKRTIRRTGGLTSVEKIEIELYDAQAAQVHIAKMAGRYKTNIEIDWKRELKEAGLDPDAVEQGIVDGLEQHLLGSQSSPDGSSGEEGEAESSGP